MLRIAMLSGWHVHARGYADEFNSMENVKVTTVWDEDAARGEAWAKDINAEFISDLDTLLKRSDIDAVAVCAPTNMHPQVIIAAAKAGKHIFTEKVLALTVKECDEIITAVKEAGVKFCISFPHRTNPANLFAKKVVDENLIGDINLLRVRNAHNGAVGNWLPPHFYDEKACGGGAMIDLGAHPMYLSAWLLGKPATITSMFNSFTGKPVEDNAVSVIEFENKAIAISETGFDTPVSPFCLELYGTEGSLFIGGPDNQVKIASNKLKSDVPGMITVSHWNLPKAIPGAIQQFIDAIVDGKEVYFGLDEARQLTELMEAAYISHRENRKVSFQELR